MGGLLSFTHIIIQFIGDYDNPFGFVSKFWHSNELLDKDDEAWEGHIPMFDTKNVENNLRVCFCHI